MSRPIVALLTDFGTRDYYAGAMKGVVLSICPDATLVDITHDIPPHDVLAGALELAACYRDFPPATIFLVVVDPGVGSVRRGVAAETATHRFVAPDNGVLSAVFAETPPARVVELSGREYARPPVSRTFEGRDRFAPAAAWLAAGVRLTALGEAVAEYQRLELPRAEVHEGALIGEVIRCDRFGNLVTNIDRATVDRFAGASAITVAVGGQDGLGVAGTYAEVRPGDLCVLFGSTERLEIAVNGASAARRLGLQRGAPVTVRIDD